MSIITKMTTGKVRLSYCQLFEPEAGDDEIPKYKVTLLVPKQDLDTMSKVHSCVNAAKERALAKGNRLPEQCKTNVKDGDGVRDSGEPFGEECKGHYVMTVTTKDKPTLLYRDESPLTDPRELYSGCYARAVINFFGYDSKGRKGVSAGLLAVMKLSDGEPFTSNTVTASDWDNGWKDEDETQDFSSLVGGSTYQNPTYQGQPTAPTYQGQPTAPTYPPQPTAPTYPPQPTAPTYPPQSEVPPYQPQPTAPTYPPQPEVPPYQPQPTAPTYPPQPTAPTYQGQPEVPPYQGQPEVPPYQGYPQAPPYQG